MSFVWSPSVVADHSVAHTRQYVPSRSPMPLYDPVFILVPQHLERHRHLSPDAKTPALQRAPYNPP